MLLRVVGSIYKVKQKKRYTVVYLFFWLPQFDGKHQRVHKLRLFGLGFEPTVQVVIINHSPLWLQTVHRTVCLTRRALRALLGINACVTATRRRFNIQSKTKKEIHCCVSLFLAPPVGFEPTTLRLTAGCSTAEL